MSLVHRCIDAPSYTYVDIPFHTQYKKATVNTEVGIPVALLQDPIDSILVQVCQYDRNRDCSQHAIASLPPLLYTGANESITGIYTHFHATVLLQFSLRPRKQSQSTVKLSSN